MNNLESEPEQDNVENPNIDKIKNIFKGKNIYVEIFNNNNDRSDLLDEILHCHGANLGKNLDCIIYKEGKNKTIEYSLKNNIKLVNPLWVHESILKEDILDMENYLIKKTYTDIYLENSIFTNSNSVIKKRKFDELSKSPNKTPDAEIKKRKLDNKSETKNKKMIDLKEVLKPSTFEKQTHYKIVDDEINPEEKEKGKEIKKKEIPQTNKITNFFKNLSSEKIVALKINEKITEVVASKNENNCDILIPKDKILIISSIGFTENNKYILNNIVTQLGKYKYKGEKFENIKESEYIVVMKNFNKNDLKFAYGILNEKKFIYINYFIESLHLTSYKENIQDYLHIPPESKIISLNRENLPFKIEKYKIFLHQSIYDKEPLRKEACFSILKLLGLEEIENNIRQADICIVNKIYNNEYFPGHLKLLNESFLIECLYNFKVMDLNNWTYKPEINSSSKNK